MIGWRTTLRYEKWEGIQHIAVLVEKLVDGQVLPPRLVSPCDEHRRENFWLQFRSYWYVLGQCSRR